MLETIEQLALEGYQIVVNAGNMDAFRARVPESIKEKVFNRLNEIGEETTRKYTIGIVVNKRVEYYVQSSWSYTNMFKEATVFRGGADLQAGIEMFKDNHPTAELDVQPWP